MKKLLIILLILGSIFPVYSQYMINVSAQWMNTFATDIAFSGDYSGTAVTSFSIGPYSSPFTVTLTILNEYENALGAYLGFACWNINQSDFSHSVTITVDDTNPVVDAVALYVNIEPSPHPTPEPTPPGSAWLDPRDRTVRVNEEFTWEIHVNTDDQLLALYEIDVSWPPDIMSVDTSKGNNGVDLSPDGWIIAIPLYEDFGTITLSGFDVNGAGPSHDLHLCNIYYIAGAQPVTNAVVEVSVDKFVNPDTYTIGYGLGLDSTITIKLFYGDVNEDGTINIIDALLVAQYYVGLNPAAYTAPVEAGDSNLDGNVDIVDALNIAQYYVGLCQCPNFPPLD